MIKKGKDKLLLRIIHWPLNHPWLKIIAFVLAVVLWFYARAEMNNF